MLAFLRASQFLLAASAVLSILASAAGLLPFVVVYQIAVAAGTPEGLDWSLLAGLAGVAFIGVVAKAGLTAAASHLSHVAAYDTLYRIRLALVEKLARLPLGYFSSRTTGEVARVLNEDVERIEEAIAHAVPDIASALAVPVVSGLLLAFVDWRLALAALAMFPVLAGLYPLTVRMGGDSTTSYFAALGRLKAVTIQLVQGMKVLKAFLRTDATMAEFRASVDAVADISERYGTVSLVPMSALSVGLRANVLVLLPAGGLLLLGGGIDAETFVLFLLVGMGLNAPVMKLMLTAGTFYWRIKAAGTQILALLDEPEIAAPPVPRAPSGYDIVFDRVGFSYGDAPVLQGVDFTAQAGTVTAIVGPSGAGKTTIAHLVARFWDVDSGSIQIGGVDVREMEPDALMRCIGFVFQDAYLFNDTIRANILMGSPDAEEAALLEAVRLARVDAFLAELPEGLDTVVGERGLRLSGGQRQRIAIARAILKKAPIILLDEATASLDPETEAEVAEALRNLGRESTVLAIAHRLQTIRNADQILFVDGGRVVARGCHDDLFAAHDGYRRMWQRLLDTARWRLPAGATVPAVPAPLEPAVSSDTRQVRDRAEPVGEAGSIVSLFLRLAGPMRATLLRRAMPLLFLEGLLYGAPVIATFLALSDTLAGTLTPTKLWTYTSVVALLLLIQGVLNCAANKILWRIQARAVAALQDRIGRHLRRLPLGTFSEIETGAFESAVTQHAAEINFVTPPGQLLRVLVGPVISLAVMAWLDWRLALAAAATLPLFVLVMRHGDRIFHRVWRDLSEAKLRANSRIIDYVQGMAVIRSYGLGGERFQALADALKAYRDTSLATVLRLTPSVALGLTILDLGFCLLLLVGGSLYLGGSLSLPVLLLFLVIGLVFYAPIADAFELVAYGRLLQRSIRVVNAVLARPTLPEPEVGREPRSVDIRFRDASFSYGEHLAIERVNLHIPAGGVTAFVGRSGSGKTTALHLIARFWDLEKGSVEIGGVDLREMTSERLHSLFSIVFQDSYLFNDTVSNNLRLGRPEATREEVEAAARAARCHDTIVALPKGYETRIGEGGATLSGGERQRIAIARALLKDAPIVLLDEATASVDPDTELEVRQALGSLTEGRTVVVVAHKPMTVATADQIVVFEAGQVVGQGGHDDLLRDCPLYRRFWARASDSGVSTVSTAPQPSSRASHGNLG